ncbi:MAG: tetratricopeptide repeat protein [Pseudomonadota bacterium]
MNLVERLLALFGLRLSPEALTRKANFFASKENVAGAVEHFKKALAADQMFVPAYDGLGRLYFRMGFRTEADREFAIADGLEKLQTDSPDVEAAVKMGWAMMDKGLYSLAVSKVEPLLKLNPRHPELLKVLGISYKVLGNDKRARELLRTGLERWPRVIDFYQHLGSLESKAGNMEEGERLLNISRLMAKAESDPLDTEARYHLGNLFHSCNQDDLAAEYLRQALAVDKEKIDHWMLLGECYLSAGLYPAAEDALRQASRLAPVDPRPHRLLAKVYQLMGRFDEGRQARELTAVLEAGQGEAESAQQGARFIKYLLAIGRSGEAEQRLQELMAKWPGDLDLKILQGRLIFRRKDYTEAIAVLQEVAQAKETLAEPHIWMALAYQRLGDPMSSLAEGQLATRLAPKSYAAYKVLGDILREQRKFGMAENAYETAEHLRPGKKEK